MGTLEASLISHTHNTPDAMESDPNPPSSPPKPTTKLPIAIRAKMAPQTAAMPEFPMSALVRSRLSRMGGMRAAGAKVEMNERKKANQACRVCMGEGDFK